MKTDCHLLHLLAVLCFAASSAPLRLAAEEGERNLVVNGDFETDADGDGVPDGWKSAGRREIEQRLTLAPGRVGAHAARLSCTKFVSGTPDSHAMVCQTGVVSVRAGQWYRIRFWTKGSGITRRVCQMQVSDTRTWTPTGIAVSFAVTDDWSLVEKMCQAKRSVSAEDTRLQFWYASTGELWLDDVSITAVAFRPQMHPQIPLRADGNSIPNSSFECGAVGWGSYAPDLNTWTGNVYRLLGRVDTSAAYHGRRSLRLHLSRERPPVFFFDYFDPLQEPVLAVVNGHLGWLPVSKGKRYVFSCYLRAERESTPALLLVQPGVGRAIRRSVRVGRAWSRHEFAFQAGSDFVWCGAGLDLSEGKLAEATLWMDAAQFEPGASPSAYAPRARVEVMVDLTASGHVFRDPAQGVSVVLRAWNDGASLASVNGKLAVTDFLDNHAGAESISFEVPAKSGVAKTWQAVAGRTGFFRVHWESDAPHSVEQSVRCAVVRPYRRADSPFGMNHAYPWSFMLDLCRDAGLMWMRDWTVKWHTVEAKRDHFDFGAADAQIDRVLRRQLNVLVLLPFASTPWSSGGDPEAIRKLAKGHPYYEKLYTVACAARDDALWSRYARRTAEHYRDRVTCYEILNEPLYTRYAVPRQLGYKLEDYLRLLRLASQAIKSAQPNALVAGGIGTWVSQDLVLRFVEEGGLSLCDAMDIHLYPVTAPPEGYEPDLIAMQKLMRQRGQEKPIWLTEFGCYADDDPYRTPAVIGDTTMSRSNWPTEQAAAEALVKTAAVFMTYGIERILFHAGTCGPLNGRNGGGIFFEYGGAPRKMYAAVSSVANLLGPHPRPITPPVVTDSLRAHLFRTTDGPVAIAWAPGAKPTNLRLPRGVTAFDIMGNRLSNNVIPIDATPVFLRAPNESALRNALD